MSVRLPDHDHCRFCGDPVPFEQAYCSEDCYWKDQAKMKKEKRDNIIFVAAAGASVAVILLVGAFVL